MSNAGNSIGDGLKGAWNAFHGAGETIRGTINGAVDGAGEAIAQRDTSTTGATTTSTATDPVVRHDTTVNQGKNEVRSAFNKL